MTHDEFVSRLDGVKRQGSGHVARCPAHEDRRQSLGVNQGDDGRTLIRCYAGCTAEQVVAALGLEVKDLFEFEPKATEPVAIYDYVDEAGELVHQVLRMPEKSFRQRRPDGEGGWVWKMEGVERVPYRLPEVIEAVANGETVYIVEGEKDADAIVSHGRVATCNPGGAGKWQDAWALKYFRDAKVIIVADTDDAGKAHARAVMSSLAPVAAGVWVVRAKTGKDAYDHLRAGHELNELVPFELDEVTDGLALIRADTLVIEQIDWIEGFKGYYPYGGISMLFGHPGVNKSTLTAMLASIVNRTQQRSAIFFSPEGGAPEMQPRLFVAGADLSRCHFLEKRENGSESVVTLPHDVQALEALIEKHNVGLVVIDPIDSALGLDVDSYKAQEVRFALTPLHSVARRHKCAIVLVSHLNQDKSTDPIRRAGGPRLTGLARACSLMAPSWHDTDTRFLAGFKTNGGPLPKGKELKVETGFVPGHEDPAVRLYEFGTCGLTAKQLLMEKKDD